ncbi:FAD-dependent monooxygenase [Trujillonella endophytica]|uniref:2-polyprenyl-6-methoxyphenol hydroxylase n=1 Tax=Trujillonella endophytica TaxID=673521 RepID=A0A1H8WDT0_9ACTN|nr:FAD-dependent monooxygenase [Trujillella endophytica]SEP25796.1 2-polyprenyl-6-methoxyphenol hydroxylase [Trujillella endophytica]
MSAGSGDRAGVRTLLRMRTREGCEERFEEAWRAAAAEISRVPGNLRQELVRDADDPRTFLITSDWVDRAAVDAFGRSSAREFLTAALRDLREDASRSTYEVLYEVPGDRGPHVRVDIRTVVGPGEEELFERAYRTTVERLRGTPGLIREELLKEPAEPIYHIFAEWETEQDFTNWVDDPSHADQTATLVRWLSVDFDRRLYEIRYRPPEHGSGDGGYAPPPPRTEPPRAMPAPTPVPVPSAPVQEFVEPPRTAPAPAPAPASPAPSPAPPRTGRADAEVLVVGAGPAGLTHAIELARRGIAVRVVDKRSEASTQADKAIGIHCRTMEIWEDQGIAAEAMDTGIWLHGQTVFVNGVQTHQVDWSGLEELPYAHLGLPQYETERLLTARLLTAGVAVERGVELVGFDQDDDGVTARLQHASGEVEDARARYLVGCDGAHSAVRTGLGLGFVGGLSMFPQLFMLGDVDVDWGAAPEDVPPGHLLRWVRIEDDGAFTGMLVCVPLKGRRRYRIATLAPQRLQETIGSGIVPAGFWQEYEPPTLADLQAAVDDLGPPGTTASNLRWSSIFRIKHGIVDRYRSGRVFVAGDAAHLHPPAGGQGMNTGIQDAWNLGWKLALAVRGLAAPGLLDSYDAERRPAGKAIVDRAVAIAFTDEMDMDDEKAQFLLEMQMTMNYAGSPLVGQAADDAGFTGGPEPGHRAPDVHGLRRFGVAHDLRLFDLTRGTHTTLLLAVDADVPREQVLELEKLTAAVRQASRGQVRPYLLADAAARLPALVDLPVLRAPAAFRAAYGLAGGDPAGPAGYVVRPDGHVGFRARPVTDDALLAHLGRVFAP